MTVLRGDPKSTLIGVVLGASSYPKSSRFDSIQLAPAFQSSKRGVTQLLLTMANEILDLFDSEQLPNPICESLADFLSTRPWATDLIVYYVGHGSFLKSDQAYYLALRSTSSREHATGLRASDLAQTIKQEFANRRIFLVLDCCFAGSAVHYFQSPVADIIERQLLPYSGIALLNASSKDKAAVVPKRGRRTMFSDCFCETLSSGLPGRGPRLSLRDLCDAISIRIRQKYPEEAQVWPEVHAPRQPEGVDIASYPFFPNAAYDDPPTLVRQPEATASSAVIGNSIVAAHESLAPPPLPLQKHAAGQFRQPTGGRSIRTQRRTWKLVSAIVVVVAGLLAISAVIWVIALRQDPKANALASGEPSAAIPRPATAGARSVSVPAPSPPVPARSAWVLAPSPSVPARSAATTTVTPWVPSSHTSRTPATPPASIPRRAIAGAPSVSVRPVPSSTTTTVAQGTPSTDTPSIIGVIPPSPPPELDPLVKAVLEDDRPTARPQR